jgi:tRNA(Ile)-lysidine synthase
MQERFLAYNREKKLLEKNDKILCAVSGGIDSIVMAHLFIEAGYNISIAHVNHKKRGKESDEDALFVKNYAKANEIPYFEMTLKEPKSSQNFQEYAREERYKWFQLLVKENGISKIATAHHKDDVIETFLFNAMRGSGINGLTSIQVKNNNIIRPILCFTKQEIEDYATKNNLSYREDSSNSENKYARNKIRNILIPSFTETNNNALKGLSNTIEVINDEAILLQELIKNAKKKWITNLGAKLFIDLNKIGKFKGKLSLLHYLTIDFGFTKDQLSNILSLPTNGSIFETKTHLAVKHQNLLEIIKLEDVDKIMPLEITREGEYNYGDYLLRIELVDAVNIEYGE